MRFLSKIIFLNSAHIPFAEVKLDGNVHFIGTQGVGKSTLLRALLFFYNADKLKLGIPKEKKSFDAFYFPYANSYIVYEVTRENGPYCVVAAKSQGRVFFRFVDAPFNQEWFMDERNEIYAEWGRIREKIGPHYQISAQVTGYEMYRDIIFGNNRRQEMLPYRKFAIVESTKYQNIPRTIQNVFLNSKLDADFIKDTIIHSMNDEEVSVDLDFYRSQINEFEQEYTDVMLWFTKNKNGEILVRKKAQKVIDSYRELIYTQELIRDARVELNYAEKRALQDIPAIKEDITKHEQERNRTIRLIEELEQKHKKERDELVARIGSLSDTLKLISKKHGEYEMIGIEQIIHRVAQEEIVAQEAKQLEERKGELTKAHEDVTSKYRALFERLKADSREYENQQKERVLERKTILNSRTEELMQTLRKSEKKIYMAYEEKLQTAEEIITQARDEEAKYTLQSLKIAQEHPHAKEIKDLEESIEQAKERARELEANIRQCKQDSERVRCEGELEREKLDHEYKLKLDRTFAKKEEAASKVKELEAVLTKQKGSFFEWLEQNKPGWQENIGKAVDENEILYSNELQPRLTDERPTLFGVSVNLSSIQRTTRTPEILKQELEEYLALGEAHSREWNRLNDELSTSATALGKKYMKRVRDFSEKVFVMQTELDRIPDKLKNLQAECNTWKTREETWRKERESDIQNRKNEITHLLYIATANKKKLQAERERQLKVCQKTYTDTKASLQKEMETFEANIQQEIARRQEKTNEYRIALQQSQDAELQGKGADVGMIRQLDMRIKELMKELDYIKIHRTQVSDYEKDKRELLDREPEFRQQKKDVEAKQENLENKYTARRDKLLLQKKEAGEIIQKYRDELNTLEKGVKEVKHFREDELFSPKEFSEPGEKPTRKSCAAIVNELKTVIFAMTKKIEVFKKSVIDFNGNFSRKNTFHFRTELVSDQDYHDFASGLCEFVDNDKISDYQKHISERYTDIIHRISKEVSDLTRHENDIHKTIGAINHDFIARNFAGVIKEITLRAQPSSDKLMQLLLEIKHFNETNQYNMGKIDLFSQGSRDEVNATAVRYLFSFMRVLLDDPAKKRLALSDTFKLEFRIKENDNDTGWVEKISNVGSDGTDILVKAMVNIMLINVFKEKASRKFGDFKIHCMMDEIGKLHPNNVKGILDFANCRNILLINSSPTTYNVEDYRYTYLLNKDSNSNTLIIPLLTHIQKEDLS